MRKILLVITFVFAFIFAFSGEQDFFRTRIEKVEGSYIIVRIQNRDVQLKLAPRWFLDENGYFFRTGEEIDVRFNDSYQIIEVIKDGKRYKFTDDTGAFLWMRGGVTGEGDRRYSEPDSSANIIKDNSKDNNRDSKSKGRKFIEKGRRVD